MLDTVIYARDKWLVPGGVILPDKARARAERGQPTRRSSRPARRRRALQQACTPCTRRLRRVGWIPDQLSSHVAKPLPSRVPATQASLSMCAIEDGDYKQDKIEWW
jgi:hypothetical protein